MPKKENKSNPEPKNKLPQYLEEKSSQTELVDITGLFKRLESATAYIRKEVGNAVKSICRIGFKLWEVRENKLYLGMGYKNTAEYGEKVLGFKKSTIANYISICERFSVHTDGKPSAVLVDNFADFSYSQLSLLLSVPQEKLPEITPDTSCREILKIKKSAEIPSDSGEEEDQISLESPVRISPPIEVFSHVLTHDNLSMVHKLLSENIGREISVFVSFERSAEPEKSAV